MPSLSLGGGEQASSQGQGRSWCKRLEEHAAYVDMRANMRALHFHHVEPANKRFELNANGVSLALATLRAEAQKCVLLCSNCHAEVEDGTAVVPADRLQPQIQCRTGPG